MKARNRAREREGEKKGRGSKRGRERRREGEGEKKHLGERTLRDIVSKNQAILGLGESDGVKIAFSFDILSIKDEWMKYFLPGPNFGLYIASASLAQK